MPAGSAYVERRQADLPFFDVDLNSVVRKGDIGSGLVPVADGSTQPSDGFCRRASCTTSDANGNQLSGNHLNGNQLGSMTESQSSASVSNHDIK